MGVSAVSDSGGCAGEDDILGSSVVNSEMTAMSVGMLKIRWERLDFWTTSPFRVVADAGLAYVGFCRRDDVGADPEWIPEAR